MTISDLWPHGSAHARSDADSAKTPVDPYPEPANVVYRFGVHLRGTDPPIWRLIDVPAEYSFWDLHVAIQDAMGWLDYHLHEFSITAPDSGKRVTIGIPDFDLDFDFGCRDALLPDSECAIADYFLSPGDDAIYVYDFGDGWQHKLALSRVLPREPGVRYPVCRDGERTCPPEDCGGVGGFRRFLDVLADPDHKEHMDTETWLIEHVGRYHPYDPEDFDPAAVTFDDPQERWLRATAPLSKSPSHC